MKKWIGIPNIPLSEQTQTEKSLLDVVDRQQGMIDDLVKDIEILKEEIKRLKGKPCIKPSKMDKDNGIANGASQSKKRSGSEKRNKNAKLTIHEEKTIPADNIPAGSRFKGYQYYTVQDIVIQTKNTRYRLEKWQLPTGQYQVASLPSDIIGYHYGATLRSFVGVISIAKLKKLSHTQLPKGHQVRQTPKGDLRAQNKLINKLFGLAA